MKIKIILAIILGFIYGVPFTPVVCLFRILLVVPFTKRKMLDKVIKQGHIVEARLIRQYDAAGKDGFSNSSRQVGVYQYEYNNKIYKTERSSTLELPDSITLYFIKNPKRAVDQEELGTYESPLLKCYFVSVLIMCVVMIYIGVKYGFGLEW